jgi:hypothetical protein
VTRALHAWENLAEFLKNGGDPIDKISKAVFVGGVFNDSWRYRLYLSARPRIPSMPSYIYIVDYGETYRYRLSSKKIYVKVLRTVAKSFIVRV